MYYQEVLYLSFRNMHVCLMLMSNTSTSSTLSILLLSALNSQMRSLIRYPLPNNTFKFPTPFWIFLSEFLGQTYKNHEDQNQIHYLKVVFTCVFDILLNIMFFFLEMKAKILRIICC